MLAVREEHRGKGIATKLVRMAIDMMIEREADEVCTHLLSPGPVLDAKIYRSLSRPKSPTLRR